MTLLFNMIPSNHLFNIKMMFLGSLKLKPPKGIKINFRSRPDPLYYFNSAFNELFNNIIILSDPIMDYFKLNVFRHMLI